MEVQDSYRKRVIVKLVQALSIMGQELSDLAIEEMMKELDLYKPEHVIISLEVCKRKCRRIYLVDILENLPKKRIVYT